MAENEEEKKVNRVLGYTRTVKGQPQQVKAHVRSNPSTSHDDSEAKKK